MCNFTATLLLLTLQISGTSTCKDTFRLGLARVQQKVCECVAESKSYELAGLLSSLSPNLHPLMKTYRVHNTSSPPAFAEKWHTRLRGNFGLAARVPQVRKSVAEPESPLQACACDTMGSCRLLKLPQCWGCPPCSA